MTDTSAIALALVLGLLAGLWAGSSVGIRLERRRRALSRVNGRLARLVWPNEMPARSAADILAGVIHVRLGARLYDLPVLPRPASRRWLENLDQRYAAFADQIEASNKDTPAIMAALVAESDGLYDMLRSYDAAGAGILPPYADIEESVTDTEILRAILEVWRTVDPKVDIGARPAEPPTPGSSPAPPTTPREPTDGAPIASAP